MDIFQRLKLDHDRQRDLMARILRAADEPQERCRLFADLCVELDAHAAAEEQTFYAALLRLSRCPERVRRSVDDHDAVADLLGQLACTDADAPEWLDRFKALESRLSRHLDKEEAEDFPLVRRHLDDDLARSLGARFADLKAAEFGGSIALASPLLPNIDDLAGFGGMPLPEFRF